MLNDTKRYRWLLYGVTIIFLVWAFTPYYWLFRTSVLTNLAAVSSDTSIIPALSKLTIQPYLDIWDRWPFVTFFRNSIIVAVSATVISMFFAIPGAYAFARLDFPGKKWLFYTAVFTIMFPWLVLTIPVYGIFLQLQLIDTLIGVIIALSIFVLPQNIWLLQGFFRQGVPPNIEEAALLDGDSEITAFLRIVLPLSAPAVSAAGLFAFLISWNNFLWVFILISEESKRTATVAIHYLLGADTLREWNILMASVVLLVAPPIIFYALSQRYVGEGLGGL